jgi:2-keto-4-pentenoate hydratase/2-oxohepta-3-ene-1,7-dioic acid hydratase in catechol pathway
MGCSSDPVEITVATLAKGDIVGAGTIAGVVSSSNVVSVLNLGFFSQFAK